LKSEHIIEKCSMSDMEENCTVVCKIFITFNIK